MIALLDSVPWDYWQHEDRLPVLAQRTVQGIRIRLAQALESRSDYRERLNDQALRFLAEDNATQLELGRDSEAWRQAVTQYMNDQTVNWDQIITDLRTMGSWNNTPGTAGGGRQDGRGPGVQAPGKSKRMLSGEGSTEPDNRNIWADLERLDTHGDGDCFYHALIRTFFQMFGEYELPRLLARLGRRGAWGGDLVQELRNLLADWLITESADPDSNVLATITGSLRFAMARPRADEQIRGERERLQRSFQEAGGSGQAEQQWRVLHPDPDAYREQLRQAYAHQPLTGRDWAQLVGQIRTQGSWNNVAGDITSLLAAHALGLSILVALPGQARPHQVGEGNREIILIQEGNHWSGAIRNQSTTARPAQRRRTQGTPPPGHLGDARTTPGEQNHGQHLDLHGLTWWRSDAEDRDTVFTHRYGWLKTINDGDTDRALTTPPGSGWRLNCVLTAIATHMTITEGTVFTAPAYSGDLPPTGLPIHDILTYANDTRGLVPAGTPPRELTPATIADIVTALESAGPGAHAFVTITPDNTDRGHVINAVHDPDGVLFLDGQTGWPATLPDDPTVTISYIPVGTTEIITTPPHQPQSTPPGPHIEYDPITRVRWSIASGSGTDKNGHLVPPDQRACVSVTVLISRLI